MKAGTVTDAATLTATCGTLAQIDTKGKVAKKADQARPATSPPTAAPPSAARRLFPGLVRRLPRRRPAAPACLQARPLQRLPHAQRRGRREHGLRPVRRQHRQRLVRRPPFNVGTHTCTLGAGSALNLGTQALPLRLHPTGTIQRSPAAPPTAAARRPAPATCNSFGVLVIPSIGDVCINPAPAARPVRSTATAATPMTSTWSPTTTSAPAPATRPASLLRHLLRRPRRQLRSACVRLRGLLPGRRQQRRRLHRSTRSARPAPAPALSRWSTTTSATAPARRGPRRGRRRRRRPRLQARHADQRRVAVERPLRPGHSDDPVGSGLRRSHHDHGLGPRAEREQHRRQDHPADRWRGHGAGRQDRRCDLVRDDGVEHDHGSEAGRSTWASSIRPWATSSARTRSSASNRHGSTAGDLISGIPCRNLHTGPWGSSPRGLCPSGARRDES